MYLEKIRSNGIEYLYLRQYDSKIKFGTKKRFVFRFGRLEEARKKMIEWEKGNENMPKELKDLGCTRDDLRQWIVKTTPLTKRQVLKETSSSAVKII